MTSLKFTARLRALGATILVGSTLVAGALAQSATPAAAADLSNVSLKLKAVADGLSEPIALAWRHDDARMYVAEQTGKIRIVNTNGTLLPTPVVTIVGATGNEQGVLGFTFNSAGTKLYVDHNATNGDIHITEWTMNGDIATPSSKRELLSIPHSTRDNHNGGEIIYGPDGNLYISVGDGGGGGDPDGNGQKLSTLLGKILRISPTPHGTSPYTIPSSNPFVGQQGKRGEIWMWGLRNPWRFSFDRDFKSMWIGDAGQDLYEEVDVASPGQKGTNWGWNKREGFHPYLGGAKPAGAQDPLIEMPHTENYCAVIGGYVYRGTAIPLLKGAYVFGDFCRSPLVAITVSGGHASARQDLGVGVSGLTSFGEDPSGELYAIARSGTVYKIVSGSPPPPSSGYWEANSDGRVWGFHGATSCNTTNASATALTVGLAGGTTGYWTVTSAGAITACHKLSYGSMAGKHLNHPIIGMAATAAANGYWLVGTDGGIFGFGGARFYGSTGSIRLNKPVVAMTATPTGHGYWFVASDGGIFGYGDAHFYGSMGGKVLKKPIVGMAASPTGHGYWLVASDGGIFGFGDAKFHGSTGSRTLSAPITGMAITKTGAGYWMVASSGALYPFGDARNFGSIIDSALHIIGIAHN